MHKKTKLLAAVALFGLQAVANDIEPSKENYSVPFTTQSIVIDGALGEWSGVPILADPKFSIPKGKGSAGTYVLFEEYGGGTWSGPDDQTSAVQIVYDAENVYFGFVVTDDYHENAANSAVGAGTKPDRDGSKPDWETVQNRISSGRDRSGWY